MPWYELALLAAGLSGGCFIPKTYAKLKAKAAALLNEPDSK